MPNCTQEPTSAERRSRLSVIDVGQTGMRLQEFINPRLTWRSLVAVFLVFCLFAVLASEYLDLND